MILAVSLDIVCFFFCFGDVITPKKTPPVNTFCSVYQRTVNTKDEFDGLQGISKNVLDRMQHNDLYYLCKCKGWKGKECASMRR